MSGFSQMPANWAGEQALTEAAAFDYAVRTSNINKTDFNTDDALEQAFRQGYTKGIETAQQESLDKFNSILEENIELRRQLQTLTDMNNRLREAILRGREEEWD